MKITKLVHSALLIEKNDRTILVDPGAYSWQDEDVKRMDLSGIDAVVVTHNHPDHLNIDFALAVKAASPSAKWYGTNEVAEQLSDIGLECTVESKDAAIQFIVSEHADLSPWFNEQPEHTSYLLFSELLITGDCQTIDSAHGARILAGAINGGPWGAVVGFSKMIETMSDRPQIVLPLHDWHWNQAAREAIYDRLPEVMAQFDVEFMPLQNCVSTDV